MITTFMIGGYTLTFSLVFLKYIQRFTQDSTTANSDKASWFVLILASLLWPVSLPLSALERNVKKTQLAFYESESQIGLIYLDRELQTYSEFVKEKTKPEKVEV
ncbi:MAG: hypothetical protein WBA13_07415 [Microcoleaceae cyanobacterium]